MGEYSFLIDTTIAGMVASVACGLGALPLAWKRIRLERHIGYGYAAAAGLMFSASVYNLLLPALGLGEDGTLSVGEILRVLLGFVLGAGSLSWFEHIAEEHKWEGAWIEKLGGRVGALVFVAMCLHSVPEGIAVGVGFASEEHLESARGLGESIAVAISVHNIPEGLAVALPMRAKGASIPACFFFAFLTSLPQPVAAVPASLLVWVFEPLILPSLGFAAGAMIYLVVAELLPEALESKSPRGVAWSFVAGFGTMAFAQIGL